MKNTVPLESWKVSRDGSVWAILPARQRYSTLIIMTRYSVSLMALITSFSNSKPQTALLLTITRPFLTVPTPFSSFHKECIPKHHFP